MKKEHLDANQDFWNAYADLHVDSDFYDMPSFITGRNSLNNIELDLLGDIKGKRVLHLQCHFGQDTISLARMGASVTGVDFSEQAIGTARKLADQLKADAEFVCCNVLELDQHLEGQFDLIFTSYGTIGWLENLGKWGQLIRHYLKPEGQFMMIEFHPVVWMYDEDFNEVAYSYFNREEIKEEVDGSYAAPNAAVVKKYVSWNHSLGEVCGALFDAGLKVVHFEEYEFSPYDIFNDSAPHPKGYQINGKEGMLPLVYSLMAAIK